MILKDIKKFFFESEKNQHSDISKTKISSSLDDSLNFFQKQFDGGADLIVRKMKCSCY